MLAAAAFGTLLHMKHIYLYVALPYFVLLFRQNQSIAGVAKLAAVVLLVSSFSLLPFAHQWPALLQRLFPFKRGLMHALPAANIWVLYTTLDRVLAKLLHIATENVFARGLVTDIKMAILPDVSPPATMLLTVLSQIVLFSFLYHVLRQYSNLLMDEKFKADIVAFVEAPDLAPFHAEHDPLRALFLLARVARP